MTPFNHLEQNPFRGRDLRIAPLICGIGLGIGFAVLFFNPFTQSNIQFALRTEPMMFATPPSDMSIQALIYFAVVGLLLAGARMRIGHQVHGLVSLPIAWIAMISAGAALIYGALRLFNPALDCMLESCHSTFLLSYGLVTLGFGTLLAYNSSPGSSGGYGWSDGSSNYSFNLPGCLSGGGLIIIGVVLFITGLVMTFVVANIGGGGC